MLVGLCGAELVPPESVGASQGVLGWVAYLGAASAGTNSVHAVRVVVHAGTCWNVCSSASEQGSLPLAHEVAHTPAA
jgi:sugar phosphate permease